MPTQVNGAWAQTPNHVLVGYQTAGNCNNATLNCIPVQRHPQPLVLRLLLQFANDPKARLPLVLQPAQFGRELQRPLVSGAQDTSLGTMTTARITLGSVNVEAADPGALGSFWAAALGAEPAPGPEGIVFLPAADPGGFAMFFRPMTGPRPDRQVQHLDLTVPWGSRAAEVERLVGLGATHRWDVLDEVPWVQWTTLADPEGNLFCVAEHPPTG